MKLLSQQSEKNDEVHPRVVALRDQSNKEVHPRCLPTRRSTRSIKINVNHDFEYEDCRANRSYDLDKKKAIKQKLVACDRQPVTFEVKKKGQLRLKFSTAGYEAFRESIGKFYNQDTDILTQDELKDISVKHESIYDRNGEAIVEEHYKIFNRLKNGNVGNRSKYTINLYHTTSSALVNGAHAIDLFTNVHLRIIANYMLRYDIQGDDQMLRNVLAEMTNQDDVGSLSRDGDGVEPVSTTIDARHAKVTTHSSKPDRKTPNTVKVKQTSLSISHVNSTVVEPLSPLQTGCLTGAPIEHDDYQVKRLEQVSCNDNVVNHISSSSLLETHLCTEQSAETCVSGCGITQASLPIETEKGKATLQPIESNSSRALINSHQLEPAETGMKNFTLLSHKTPYKMKEKQQHVTNGSEITSHTRQPIKSSREMITLQPDKTNNSMIMRASQQIETTGSGTTFHVRQPNETDGEIPTIQPNETQRNIIMRESKQSKTIGSDTAPQVRLSTGTIGSETTFHDRQPNETGGEIPTIEPNETQSSMRVRESHQVETTGSDIASQVRLPTEIIGSVTALHIRQPNDIQNRTTTEESQRIETIGGDTASKVSPPTETSREISTLHSNDNKQSKIAMKPGNEISTGNEVRPPMRKGGAVATLQPNETNNKMKESQQIESVFHTKQSIETNEESSTRQPKVRLSSMTLRAGKTCETSGNETAVRADLPTETGSVFSTHAELPIKNGGTIATLQPSKTNNRITESHQLETILHDGQPTVTSGEIAAFQPNETHSRMTRRVSKTTKTSGSETTLHVRLPTQTGNKISTHAGLTMEKGNAKTTLKPNETNNIMQNGRQNVTFFHDRQPTETSGEITNCQLKKMQKGSTYGACNISKTPVSEIYAQDELLARNDSMITTLQPNVTNNKKKASQRTETIFHARLPVVTCKETIPLQPNEMQNRMTGRVVRSSKTTEYETILHAGMSTETESKTFTRVGTPTETCGKNITRQPTETVSKITQCVSKPAKNSGRVSEVPDNVTSLQPVQLKESTINHATHPVGTPKSSTPHGAKLLTEPVKTKTAPLVRFPTNAAKVKSTHARQRVEPNENRTTPLTRQPTANSKEQLTKEKEKQLKMWEKNLTGREAEVALKGNQLSSAKAHMARLEEQVTRLEVENKTLQSYVRADPAQPQKSTSQTKEVRPAAISNNVDGASFISMQQRLSDMERQVTDSRVALLEMKFEQLKNQNQASPNSQGPQTFVQQPPPPAPFVQAPFSTCNLQHMSYPRQFMYGQGFHPYSMVPLQPGTWFPHNLNFVQPPFVAPPLQVIQQQLAAQAFQQYMQRSSRNGVYGMNHGQKGMSNINCVNLQQQRTTPVELKQQAGTKYTGIPVSSSRTPQGPDSKVSNSGPSKVETSRQQSGNLNTKADITATSNHARVNSSEVTADMTADGSNSSLMTITVKSRESVNKFASAPEDEANQAWKSSETTKRIKMLLRKTAMLRLRAETEINNVLVLQDLHRSLRLGKTVLMTMRTK